jgi:hypothetical protein
MRALLLLTESDAPCSCWGKCPHVLLPGRRPEGTRGLIKNHFL